jgi:hypothetical protein
MPNSTFAVFLAAVGTSLITAVAFGQQVGSTPSGRLNRFSKAPACRHDVGAEGADDKARREQALAVARAINSAEGRVAERTQSYGALPQLGTLPRTPNGFDLHFYSNVNTYMFSLKDGQDTCHYAIFSDESGILYEDTPQRPQIGQR